MKSQLHVPKKGSVIVSRPPTIPPNWQMGTAGQAQTKLAGNVIADALPPVTRLNPGTTKRK